MAINRQKLKLLYLMRMLEEETDAERGLTMAQIIGKLEALGISAERKSIYRDIEALREFGVDVRTYQRAPVEYAVEHRAFAFAELQLLVDAVQSSRFLTQRKSDALVEGVKQLASRRQRALLDKRVHVEGRIKMQNESVFGSVDRIQEAIALKRRISFVYFKYDAAKRKALQHNGERDARAARVRGRLLLPGRVQREARRFRELPRGPHGPHRGAGRARDQKRAHRHVRRARAGKPRVRHVQRRAGGGHAVGGRGGHGRGHRPVRQGRGVGADGGEAGARVRHGDEEPRAVRVAGSVWRPRPHREADRTGAGVPRLP